MFKTRSDMEIIHWATQLMKAHGLIEKGWSFKINSRYSRALGTCNYTKKSIQICKDHVKTDTYDTVLDTLLHEIAHALVGMGHGHNKVWQAMALRIGAKPVANKVRVPESSLLSDNDEVYAVFIKQPDNREVYNGTVDKSFYDAIKTGKKKIHNLYIPGRKATTLGRLSIKAITRKELSSLAA